MTAPFEVYRDGKWSEIWILFYDENYSVISGMYEKERRRLAERWNGPLSDLPLGFPIDTTQRSAWYLIPEFLEVPILHALLDEVAKNPGRQVSGDHTELIVKELKNRYLTEASHP